MIEASNLGKRFGNFWAVKNLNLSIREGEFFCFLGPNGAGKTTTIKMFAGLIHPTEGQIRIDGKEYKEHSLDIKRIVGYIPDFPFLYEQLTAREFLDFIIEVYDLPLLETRDQYQHLLEVFRLKDYRDVVIKEFSHGMKQRLVYIANFIRNPAVLLVDEPLVGLDPYSINLIKGFLVDLTRKGCAILMSTHILSIAEELATKVGIIYRGKILCTGSIQELKKDKYKDLEEVFFQLTEKNE